MKLITFCFLLLLYFSQGLYSQEIYIDKHSKDTCLSLGGINLQDKEIKVLRNENIEFRKLEELIPVEKMVGSEFIKQLFSHKLYFKLEGYEPFWSVSIYKDTLNITLPVEGDSMQSYPVKWYCNENRINPRFFALFSTECGTVFGTINYIGTPSVGKHSVCEHNIPEEEDSLYEAYICIRDQAFVGCVTIKTQ